MIVGSVLSGGAVSVLLDGGEVDNDTVLLVVLVDGGDIPRIIEHENI